MGAGHRIRNDEFGKSGDREVTPLGEKRMRGEFANFVGEALCGEEPLHCFDVGWGETTAEVSDDQMERSLCGGDKRVDKDEKGIGHVVIQSDGHHMGFIFLLSHNTLDSVAVNGGDGFPVESIVSVDPDTTSQFELQVQGW